MKKIYWAFLAMVLIASSVCDANNVACDSGVVTSLHECARIVNSLHPDKVGQMRVFASDGSEFTAGQAQWMKGQLQLIAQACAAGNSTEAALRLAEVQRLLSQHRHAG